LGLVGQVGIFPGETGGIFKGNFEISQEILLEYHALCCIFEGMKFMSQE
jgi:hypothetical protein